MEEFEMEKPEKNSPAEVRDEENLPQKETPENSCYEYERDDGLSFNMEDALAGTIIGLAAVGACTVIKKAIDSFRAEGKGKENNE